MCDTFSTLSLAETADPPPPQSKVHPHSHPLQSPADSEFTICCLPLYLLSLSFLHLSSILSSAPSSRAFEAASKCAVANPLSLDISARQLSALLNLCRVSDASSSVPSSGSSASLCRYRRFVSLFSNRLRRTESLSLAFPKCITLPQCACPLGHEEGGDGHVYPSPDSPPSFGYYILPLLSSCTSIVRLSIEWHRLLPLSLLSNLLSSNAHTLRSVSLSCALSSSFPLPFPPLRLDGLETLDLSRWDGGVRFDSGGGFFCRRLRVLKLVLPGVAWVNEGVREVLDPVEFGFFSGLTELEELALECTEANFQQLSFLLPRKVPRLRALEYLPGITMEAMPRVPLVVAELKERSCGGFSRGMREVRIVAAELESLPGGRRLRGELKKFGYERVMRGATVRSPLYSFVRLGEGL